MFDRIAVVGDYDLIFPLRVLGMRTYSPQTVEEAREVLASLERDGVALCFLHERFFEVLRKELEAVAGRFCPVIAGFSDYRMVTDRLSRMIRDMAVKATGSDSLVRRRGNDETR